MRPAWSKWIPVDMENTFRHQPSPIWSCPHLDNGNLRMCGGLNLVFPQWISVGRPRRGSQWFLNIFWPLFCTSFKSSATFNWDSWKFLFFAGCRQLAAGREDRLRRKKGAARVRSKRPWGTRLANIFVFLHICICIYISICIFICVYIFLMYFYL